MEHEDYHERTRNIFSKCPFLRFYDKFQVQIPRYQFFEDVIGKTQLEASGMILAVAHHLKHRHSKPWKNTSQLRFDRIFFRETEKPIYYSGFYWKAALNVSSVQNQLHPNSLNHHLKSPVLIDGFPGLFGHELYLTEVCESEKCFKHPFSLQLFFGFSTR